MRFHRLQTWTFGLGLFLASCSSDRAPFSGAMFIEACSLGCSSGNGGEQVFCTVIDTARNQEIAILFSAPVDPASLNSSSFRVLNTENGSTPVGDFFVDPGNQRRLVFRPSLTFNLQGNPVFGFAENTAYQVTVPGFAQGGEAGGPYVQSVAGRPNESRLDCTISTTLPVVDPVPGAPSVTVSVVVVTEKDADGNPTAFADMTLDDPDILNAEVWRLSPITMTFDDVMLPATLANPVTGTSSFVSVQVDDDGDLNTDDDQLTVPGTFELDVDLDLLVTTLVFEHKLPSGSGFLPTDGFPSAGNDPDQPRKIELTFSTQITDLVGNQLTTQSGGLKLGFVPEAFPFDPLILPGGAIAEPGVDPFTQGSESFTWSNSDFAPPPAGETSLEDPNRAGAFWGNGRLARGVGGGSGRLGDLIVHTGDVITLSTDSQVFPLLDEQIPDLTGNPTAGVYPTTITVTDGAFEFASLMIEAGGTLVLEGSNPGRIFSRGPLRIAPGGLIDLSGGTPIAHNSEHGEPEAVWIDPVTEVPEPPQVPGQGGAGGGDGGFGAARHSFDGVSGEGLIVSRGGLNELDLPGWVPADSNGDPGAPVGPANETSGKGGSKFPAVFPETVSAGPWAASGGGQWNLDIYPDVATGLPSCVVRMVGGVGSGGGYATDGEAGDTTSTEPTAEFPAGMPSNEAPLTPAGTRIDAFLPGGTEPPSFTNDGYVLRTLEWDSVMSLLRGGSGGGGGGNHPYNTYYDGQEAFPTPVPCDDPGSILQDPSGFDTFLPWRDHSGAAGGGGGGALQLVSGRRIELDGIIDASGGNGGSARDVGAARTLDAMPGGGGSGGAVRLQALDVELGAFPGRIDVSGGAGGVWRETSQGGAGGAGLVRIETANGGPVSPTGADHDAIDQLLVPYDPTGTDYGMFSVDFLSLAPGVWATQRELPESYTGASSCWVRPEGNFFSINFAADPAGEDEPDQLGWNMHVIWSQNGTGPEQLIPFRGDNDGFLPDSFENTWGNNLNHGLDLLERSPIAVRFQGARSPVQLSDPCNTGTGPPIPPSSLTPWVVHPSELNPGPGDSWPEPNVFRFAIFFDTSLIGTAELNTLTQSIKGVTNLWIRADPD